MLQLYFVEGVICYFKGEGCYIYFFFYKNNTYLQCEILTLLTILYSTYNTKKIAILTYKEILYKKKNRK